MADVIVVDDDRAICGMLDDYLTLEGHVVRCAADSRALSTMLDKQLPDLVVLDLSLPDEDGLSITRRLRQGYDFGIIMLTGTNDLTDKVVSLEIGADDYVTKPFSLLELGARIQAILRRRRAEKDTIVPFGAFSLDLKCWKLFEPDGREVNLFPTEIDLIAAFATNPGRMLSRDEILRLAPAYGTDPLDRSIDTRITRLRRKLESHGLDGDLVKTSRGNGYIYRGTS
ncbi:response regulator transcription factor [Chelatococcus asaccharovorans]|uniref:DNA-binding response OmpR family regulator n=1 Tax=Chelatococcus asaccharovorans TaxID=28210 RepID=A0A2V3UD80_9HYPH|nr:response regulator transcription factor [Chelatococcus asaccharovorans]MBS7707006.1 response regulator transcription factor [Chelatococcus asaccharovorans]PXW63186.1 DNA-binding response OmpR family regulator [Chelatococcus asaccharovorans]CAH1653375.1 DNA-binding response OmpR family regulator [Chelatococcus asaccharovorans]CAH1694086.1 DNA-binding response OmpR family regulator [Chelatococcus asaccharovorans]